MHRVGRQSGELAWASPQPAPLSDSDAVSTASGRPCSVVSAWAWAKTSGTTDTSSRMFRAARAFEVSASTWSAAGAGRPGAGASREMPRRARVGSSARPRLITAYWLGYAGILVSW